MLHRLLILTSSLCVIGMPTAAHSQARPNGFSSVANAASRNAENTRESNRETILRRLPPTSNPGKKLADSHSWWRSYVARRMLDGATTTISIEDLTAAGPSGSRDIMRSSCGEDTDGQWQSLVNSVREADTTDYMLCSFESVSSLTATYWNLYEARCELLIERKLYNRSLGIVGVQSTGRFEAILEEQRSRLRAARIRVLTTQQRLLDLLPRQDESTPYEVITQTLPKLERIVVTNQNVGVPAPRDACNVLQQIEKVQQAKSDILNAIMNLEMAARAGVSDLSETRNALQRKYDTLDAFTKQADAERF